MSGAWALVLSVLWPAYAPYTTSAGATVHWDSATLCYHLGADLPAGWPRADVEALVAGSLAAWADLECAPREVRYDGLVPVALVDPAAGSGTAYVWVHHPADWRWSPSAYAMTTLTARRVDGVILDADVEVNVGGHPWSLAAACPPDRVDLQNTLTHEAGHVMGLDHSLVPGATLFGAADPGTTYMRDLAADDVEGYCWLAAAFPPSEATAPCLASSPDPGPEAAAEPGGADAVPVADAAPPDEADGGGGAGGCAARGSRPRAGGLPAWLALAVAMRAVIRRAGPRTRP